MTRTPTDRGTTARGTTATGERRRLSTEVVVAMAAEIADAEGLDAVTLSRIAADAGVRQPALYKHVAGIEDLWTRLALTARERLAASLMAAIGDRRRHDAVRAAADAWRAFVVHHPGLYTATDRVPSVGDPAIEASLASVVGALSRSLDGWNLDPARRAHCARSLRSALHGFCVLEKDHGHPEPYAVDESLENLVALFCGGVTALEESLTGSGRVDRG